MTLREIFNKILDFDLGILGDWLFYGIIIFGFFIFYPYILFIGTKRYIEEYKTYSLLKKIGMALSLILMTSFWLLALILYFFF